MRITLSATIIGVAAFCSISCGGDRTSQEFRESSTVESDAISLVERDASRTLGLVAPVQLVEFNVGQALQNGRFLDAAGKALDFCWDGRWSMSRRELERGFYVGPCPPAPGGLSPDTEHAVVVLAAISVRRSLPCNEIQAMAEYQQENRHGAPWTQLGPRAWGSRLLSISRVPRYSVAGRILDCEP
jgi:hypothetical protein